MCGYNVFKLYKMQIQSENHEIRQELMRSYVKFVINNWEGFEQVGMHGV
jgi:hypothetical protein